MRMYDEIWVSPSDIVTWVVITGVVMFLVGMSVGYAIGVNTKKRRDTTEATNATVAKAMAKYWQERR